MAEIARSPEDLHIATRIDCLRRAVASAEQAAASGTTASGHIYAAEQDDFTNHENLLDLKDSLEIAGRFDRCLSSLLVLHRLAFVAF